MPEINITETINLDDILIRAEELNMTSSETLELLRGSLDIINVNRKRVFNYSDPVDAAQPAACRANFVRSFVHVDWIDGESVVQAETNSIEEGFNSRFHTIEEDLDALAADVAQAFVCLGDQRAEIANSLNEVKTELNRINSDIFDCCNDGSGGPVYPWPPYQPPWVFEPYPLPPRPTPPGTPPVPPIGPPWGGWGPTGPLGPLGPSGPLIIDGPFGPLVNPGNFGGVSGGTTMPWGADIEDPVRAYLDTIGGYRSFGGAADNIVRSNADPSRGVIAGMPARLIEENSFNGQPVEVWSTAAGVILTPLSNAPADETRARWTNPRIDSVGRFARWAATNERAVREKLGASFTLGQFADAFGEEKVMGGIRVGALVDRLATDLSGKSPLDFVAPLAEMNGKAIVREGIASETVIGSVGLNVGSKNGVEKTAIDAMKSLDRDVAKGLARANVKTVGALAKLSAAEIVRKLGGVNITIALDEAAAMNAEASAVTIVDRIARGTAGG